MASEGRLCNLAEGVYSAEYTVQCLEGIAAIVSLLSNVMLSYISVHEMEVQL